MYMRKTKKVTLSAMMVALATVLIVVGGYFEFVDLTASAIASLLVIFVYVEIGRYYAIGVWLCTTLTTFLFLPAKIMLPILYFMVFGGYPILKAYIERLPRKIWLIVKLVFANVIFVALIAIYEFIFKLPLFDTEIFALKVGLYVFLNVAFVVYDIFLSVALRLYLLRFRNRIKHLLK